MVHKAGFVNIFGRPNVGKSTLMNALVGEKLSIITSKAQTTRHRILGIVNGENFQVVFSDTPGIILKPINELHKAMMGFVSTSLEDADVILFMTDIYETYDEVEAFIEKVKKIEVPKILIINKTDLDKDGKTEKIIEFWKEKNVFKEIMPISALAGTNVTELFDHILADLPESPAYYPKDALTDRPEKYFVAEIIREKIFLNYRKEIPYSSEIVIDAYEEDTDITRIRAEIFVERDSQKIILIGKKGEAMKKVGIESRKDIEEFLGKKVYLELHVRVKPKWRDNPNLLKSLGYKS